MTGKKKLRSGQYEAECFRALPDRAQEIWFQYCEKCFMNDRADALLFVATHGFDYSFCKSPIEIIYCLAYDLILDYENKALWLEPQYEIVSRDESKHFYVDFAFIANNIDDLTNIKNLDYKLVIECDGHEFHEKTKDQVAYDNEREYELKMLGYDVLRFSGSQIYDKPFRCAAQVISYIESKIGEEPNG